MGPMDGSVVNVALPTIGEHFRLGISLVGWTQIVYFIFSCSLMIAFGRVGDVIGSKRVFITGVLLFICGSVASGLSVNFTMFLICRAVQGLAAAMFSANLPALVTSSFPEEERGKALGLATTTVAIGMGVGPFFGGVLTESLGWRSIFFLTIPLGLLSAFFTYRLLPKSKRVHGEKIDLLGALLIMVFLGSLAFSVNQARRWGWASAPIISLLSASAVSAVLFVIHELRTEDPLIDIKLFKIHKFTISNAVSFLNYTGLQIVLFTTPFFLQYYLGMDPFRVGLVISLVSVMPILFLWLSGVMSDRIGTLPLEVAGMSLCTVALAIMSLAGSDLSLTILLISLGIMGLGFGIFRSPNLSAIMGSIPPARLGVAGGINGTMRTTGFLSGIALAGSVMGSWAVKKPAPEALGNFLGNPAFQNAIRNAYLAGFLVSLLGLIVCLLKFKANTVSDL